MATAQTKRKAEEPSSLATSTVHDLPQELCGSSFVFSGHRNAAARAAIEGGGGAVVKEWKKKGVPVNAVVVKGERETAALARAREEAVPIVDLGVFMSAYNIEEVPPKKSPKQAAGAGPAPAGAEGLEDEEQEQPKKKKKNLPVLDTNNVVTAGDPSAFLPASFHGINVQFTGHRSKVLENFIVSGGGRVLNSKGKDDVVGLLVVKGTFHQMTKKINDAMELGVPIIDLEGFRQHYRLPDDEVPKRNRKEKS